MSGYKSTNVDIEMVLTDQGDSYALINPLLSVLFNIEDAAISQWPGATVYVSYIEIRIRSLQKQIFDPLLKATGSSPGCFTKTLELVKAIAEVLYATKLAGTSIEEVLDNLFDRYDVDSSSRDAARAEGRQAVFATIGWFTGLIEPSPSNDSRTLRIIVPPNQSGIREIQDIELASRPIACLLRGFGSLLPQVEGKVSAFQGLESSLLHVSTLNFDSMKTIGRINIQWVDVLSAHLDFQPLTRTLMIFRFPTFIGLLCLGDRDHLFDHILREYYLSTDDVHNHSTLILAAYKREVLLSYRVIFGQTRQSRRLFLNNERKRVAPDCFYDPLLDSLCGKEAKKGWNNKLKEISSSFWPDSCKDLDGALQEQNVYNMEIDFPILGSRLQTLQAFNLRQTPSKIRDMWRDRRNPTRWYTFWAVLIIGGVSILLQIFQAFISVLQLAFQIKQLPSVQ